MKKTLRYIVAVVSISTGILCTGCTSLNEKIPAEKSQQEEIQKETEVQTNSQTEPETIVGTTVSTTKTAGRCGSTSVHPTKSFSSGSASSGSSIKNSSRRTTTSAGSYDEGYDAVYEDGDYDWDRYRTDDDYARGVDDAMDDNEEDW